MPTDRKGNASTYSLNMNKFRPGGSPKPRDALEVFKVAMRRKFIPETIHGVTHQHIDTDQGLASLIATCRPRSPKYTPRSNIADLSTLRPAADLCAELLLSTQCFFHEVRGFDTLGQGKSDAAAVWHTPAVEHFNSQLLISLLVGTEHFHESPVAGKYWNSLTHAKAGEDLGTI